MIPDYIRFFTESDRGFFIDLRTGDLYKLNATGVRTLQALQSGMDPGQISGVITSEFDVGYDQARMDIEQFIQKLQNPEFC